MIVTPSSGGIPSLDSADRIVFSNSDESFRSLRQKHLYMKETFLTFFCFYVNLLYKPFLEVACMYIHQPVGPEKVVKLRY